MHEFSTKYLGEWKKCCYIFTRNRHNGLLRLDELIEDKKKKHIHVIRRNTSTCEFSDGEIWDVVASARGRRFDKCIVDTTNITIEELECNIKPRCASVENIEYWWY